MLFPVLSAASVHQVDWALTTRKDDGRRRSRGGDRKSRAVRMCLLEQLEFLFDSLHATDEHASCMKRSLLNISFRMRRRLASRAECTVFVQIMFGNATLSGGTTDRKNAD